MNMIINLIGLVAALTAFASIWIGHVTVRKVEAVTVKLWKPMVIAVVSGTAMELGASLFSNRIVSIVLGIIGFTLLWDVIELKRQAWRVRSGHAPANLNNPRHAAMLVSQHKAAAQTKILIPPPAACAIDTKTLEDIT